MRELSKDELKLAPEWAVYFAADDNDVLFLNKDKSVGQWLVEDFDLECGFDLQEKFNVTCDQLSFFDEFHPVNTFDITSHEWSDDCYGGSSAYGDCEKLNISDGVDNSLAFNKQDAITIAKHFGLTAEDLK